MGDKGQDVTQALSKAAEGAVKSATTAGGSLWDTVVKQIDKAFNNVAPAWLKFILPDKPSKLLENAPEVAGKAFGTILEEGTKLTTGQQSKGGIAVGLELYITALKKSGSFFKSKILSFIIGVALAIVTFFKIGSFGFGGSEQKKSTNTDAKNATPGQSVGNKATAAVDNKTVPQSSGVGGQVVAGSNVVVEGTKSLLQQAQDIKQQTPTGASVDQVLQASRKVEVATPQTPTPRPVVHQTQKLE